ncbi:SDR family NAD(P)-dependent oxidoreductase [Pseudonocardia spinosispora]|uniref:SDR family NAD(P)-dependent oxidoreductase n=1 Tax=Pseudonocardia spinosispora TaxID=103441 RepID=UPI000401570E|nr:SDR family NAD(P)-dependent oxidoreductase [Pseudonocardia spinosispora]
MDIAGSRVLITGASRGIGQDLARGFAAAGADVALVARGADALEQLARGVGGRAYPCDLTDQATLRGLLARVEADGPVDILVNNAADECIGRFTDMSAETLEFMLRLNALAPAELTRQALPGMLARGRGHVVNVSSFAGIVVPPMLATYAATKAFLSHHSVNLQFELKDTPIGVTRVEIGEVADTGLMDKGRTEPALAAMFDRMYRLRLSRLIRPEEITAAVLDAVRENRWSVRLPARLSPASLLADVPRRLPWLIARGLTTPPASAEVTRA